MSGGDPSLSSRRTICGLVRGPPTTLQLYRPSMRNQTARVCFQRFLLPWCQYWPQRFPTAMKKFLFVSRALCCELLCLLLLGKCKLWGLVGYFSWSWGKDTPTSDLPGACPDYDNSVCSVRQSSDLRTQFFNLIWKNQRVNRTFKVIESNHVRIKTSLRTQDSNGCDWQHAIWCWEACCFAILGGNLQSEVWFRIGKKSVRAARNFFWQRWSSSHSLSTCFQGQW